MAQIILDHDGSGCFGTRLAPEEVDTEIGYDADGGYFDRASKRSNARFLVSFSTVTARWLKHIIVSSIR